MDRWTRSSWETWCTSEVREVQHRNELHLCGRGDVEDDRRDDEDLRRAGDAVDHDGSERPRPGPVTTYSNASWPGVKTDESMTASDASTLGVRLNPVVVVTSVPREGMVWSGSMPSPNGSHARHRHRTHAGRAHVATTQTGATQFPKGCKTSWATSGADTTSATSEIAPSRASDVARRCRHHLPARGTTRDSNPLERIRGSSRRPSIQPCARLRSSTSPHSNVLGRSKLGPKGDAQRTPDDRGNAHSACVASRRHFSVLVSGHHQADRAQRGENAPADEHSVSSCLQGHR